MNAMKIPGHPSGRRVFRLLVRARGLQKSMTKCPRFREKCREKYREKKADRFPVIENNKCQNESALFIAAVPNHMRSPIFAVCPKLNF